MDRNKPPTSREDIANLLGPNYARLKFAPPQTMETRSFLGWVVEDLMFTDPQGEKVPATFLRPPDHHPKVPAVIYAHAHGNRYDFGRDELLLGRPSLQDPYAPDFVKLGIAALCIEMPCFGARQSPNESTRAKALLWQGETLFGQMLAEQKCGVDFLCTHPSIDAGRIGAMGFSMGSTLAWWLAALDPRIKATTAQCSFADLATLVKTGGHDGHGIYMTVPGLLTKARTGQIAGLTAPRALQICVGLQDWSTPDAAFSRARHDLEAAYAAKESQNQLSFHVEPHHGHVETPDMRKAVLKFLQERLTN